MKRIALFLLALAVAAGTAQSGVPVWVTSDTPTDESLGGLTLLPWEIYKYDGASYTLELSVPGDPDLNAIHRLDEAGDWLFSVEAPSDLGGALLPAGAIAEPRDLVHYDSTFGTYTLCFSGAAGGLSRRTNINAVTIEGGDPTCPAGTGGDLLLSFDAPTSVAPFLGTASFEPSDLARFAPLGLGSCPGWTVAAANPAFDGSAAGGGIKLSSITEGADRAPDYTSGLVETILSLDVPSDVAPPAATYVPGELIETDTLSFSLFEPLGGWPIKGIVDGLSCGGNPGRVPPDIVVDKSGANLDISWTTSCSQGADDYAIYEGTIGTWYSHTALDCMNSDASPLSEIVTPGAGSRYYLVVPLSGCKGEGSYGSCNTAVCLAADERPVGTSTCTSPHVVTCCP